jgi:hypothetical protein
VGTILSQKEGGNEHVIAYANKMFSRVHKKCHHMEGKCYALVWGVMHFHQYHNCFTLMTNHKPLEWLDVVSNVYRRRGKWINTLQKIYLKIIHQARS